MKTIYLLRHAKSDWGDAALSDHDRQLNERGRDAAPRMGAYMKAHRYKPDLVLCSTARRTRETFDLVKGDLGRGVSVEYEEGLYLAEPRHLMQRLRLVDDAVTAVMFIGHNPGIAQFAIELSGSPKDAAEEKVHRSMREKFSTCALAVIESPAKSWSDVRAGGGALKDFMRPKDLKD
jgi:phosphohistidine phosphatase